MFSAPLTSIDTFPSTKELDSNRKLVIRFVLSFELDLRREIRFSHEERGCDKNVSMQAEVTQCFSDTWIFFPWCNRSCPEFTSASESITETGKDNSAPICSTKTWYKEIEISSNDVWDVNIEKRPRLLSQDKYFKQIVSNLFVSFFKWPQKSLPHLGRKRFINCS